MLYLMRAENKQLMQRQTDTQSVELRSCKQCFYRWKWTVSLSPVTYEVESAMSGKFECSDKLEHSLKLSYIKDCIG